MQDFRFHLLSECANQGACPIHPAAKPEAATLHEDGSVGLMYRESPFSPLRCTCGWSEREDEEDEDPAALWAKYDAAESGGRLTYSEQPPERRTEEEGRP